MVHGKNKYSIISSAKLKYRNPRVTGNSIRSRKGKSRKQYTEVPDFGNLHSFQILLVINFTMKIAQGFWKLQEA